MRFAGAMLIELEVTGSGSTRKPTNYMLGQRENVCLLGSVEEVRQVTTQLKVLLLVLPDWNMRRPAGFAHQQVQHSYNEERTCKGEYPLSATLGMQRAPS